LCGFAFGLNALGNWHVSPIVLLVYVGVEPIDKLVRIWVIPKSGQLLGFAISLLDLWTGTTI
jgi:hypothetical protein